MSLTFQCTVVTSRLHSWEALPTGSWGSTMGGSCDPLSVSLHSRAVESPELQERGESGQSCSAAYLPLLCPGALVAQWVFCLRGSVSPKYKKKGGGRYHFSMRSKQIKHSNDHIKGNQVRKRGGEYPGTGNTAVTYEASNALLDYLKQPFEVKRKRLLENAGSSGSITLYIVSI